MYIDLKKQKKIKFIPIVQIVTVFCWIGFCGRNNVKQSEFFKYALMMAGFMLLTAIPRMILNFIFHNDMLDSILFYISIYPTFLGFSWIAVAAQEKHNTNS